jgi:hypothetical protein
MMRLIAFTVSCQLCLTPVMALAQHGEGTMRGNGPQTVLFARHGGWFVYRGARACFALSEFENGDTFSIAANFVTNEASVNLYSQRFRSIVADETYQLQLVFSSDNSAPSVWNNSEWIGAGGGRLVARLRASDIISDVSRYASLELLRGEAIVGRYRLTDSAVALRDLRSCENAVEADNPIDPFSGERRR